MATITTINTSQLVQSLAYQFTKTAQSLESLGGSVDYYAGYVLDSRAGEETNYDGTWKTVAKFGSTSLSRTDTYNKFPFNGQGGPLATGKQSYNFTGKDLTSTTLANATGLKYTFAVTDTATNSNTTQKDAITAKIGLNPITGGDLTISQASVSNNYSRTYTGGNNGTEKTIRNEAFTFTGAADFVDGLLGGFTLKSLSASSTHGGQQGSESYSVADKLALTSKAGLNYDVNTNFSGSIDSLSYSANLTAKGQGISHKLTESFKSGAWSQDNITALNDYLSAGSADRDSALTDLVESLCSGQLIPDTALSFSSATAGGSPPLN